jgi:hypothetical protein
MASTGTAIAMSERREQQRAAVRIEVAAPA